MNITQDIRPLTEFKRDTSRVVAHLKETGRPSVLTVNGRPELVVMDAQAWQALQDEIEFARTVTGVRRGLDQAKRGQGVEAKAFFRKLKTAKA
jgi:prevent-host-death family protein